jgi:hypothetical protein
LEEFESTNIYFLGRNVAVDFPPGSLGLTTLGNFVIKIVATSFNPIYYYDYTNNEFQPEIIKITTPLCLYNVTVTSNTAPYFKTPLYD